MPKLKTKKSVVKRVKVTKSGKIKRHKAGKSHLMSGKSGNRRRHIRKAALIDKTNIKEIRRALCI